MKHKARLTLFHQSIVNYVPIVVKDDIGNPVYTERERFFFN
jgi:hypothetical protein